MDAREQRGIIIAATVKLVESHGVWVVPSATRGDKRYMVDPKKQSCTCPDHQETGFKCKHLYAVEFTVKREQSVDGTVTETRTLTFTEKKVYTQDWANYNLAQSEEKNRFKVLLHDLCRGIPEPEYHMGRPPVPVKDRLFSVVYKVYSTVSCRRFNCDFEDAINDGFISRRFHYNKVNMFLENDDLTAPLYTLIGQSALPLKSIETQFAVDATGFSTGRHVRWMDEKWGVERSGRDWVKVHAAVGTKTHIFTAVAVYGRNTNESPILPELVKGTCRYFEPKEWSADKEYLSATNIESIFASNALPFLQAKLDWSRRWTV
jgi:hypothetical protein